MAKATTVKTLDLTVTKAIVKYYDSFKVASYSNSYSSPHLCLTGTDADGQRYWTKFPAYVGVSIADGSAKPLAAVGDSVLLTARVKGQSDDGTMKFLNFAKLLVVADAPESDDDTTKAAA